MFGAKLIEGLLGTVLNSVLGFVRGMWSDSAARKAQKKTGSLEVANKLMEERLVEAQEARDLRRRLDRDDRYLARLRERASQGRN